MRLGSGTECGRPYGAASCHPRCPRVSPRAILDPPSGRVERGDMDLWYPTQAELGWGTRMLRWVNIAKKKATADLSVAAATSR